MEAGDDIDDVVMMTSLLTIIVTCSRLEIVDNFTLADSVINTDVNGVPVVVQVMTMMTLSTLFTMMTMIMTLSTLFSP